ncbi:MAG: RNA polymerase sigma-70 factor [Bacteroidota bacterium]
MHKKDLDIISGLKSGFEKAYEQLFFDYYPQLTVFAKIYVQDIEMAKEIVQTVFVRIFEKRRTISIATSIKSYLYQSVKNECLNFIRHEKIHHEHIGQIKQLAENDFVEWSDKMLETELEHKIFQLINNLPEKCRKVFNMSRFEGKKNQEIAEILKISKRTVETQISKALKILRKELL